MLVKMGAVVFCPFEINQRPMFKIIPIKALKNKEWLREEAKRPVAP